MHYDIIDLYRLSMNAEMLSNLSGRLHSLKSLSPKHQITDEDLTMLKTLTQCTIDYATTIIERETTHYE